MIIDACDNVLVACPKGSMVVEIALIPLSKAAATLPFGRFLLMVLCERHLMSMDERRVSSEATCCHPLHSQVIVFIA